MNGLRSLHQAGQSIWLDFLRLRRGHRPLATQGTTSPLDVFDDLALADVRMAADVFRPVYEETDGTDGFVSFELEARLAHDARESILAAHRLVDRIHRHNVMIKVPGTIEGVRDHGRVRAYAVGQRVDEAEGIIALLGDHDRVGCLDPTVTIFVFFVTNNGPPAARRR